MQVRQNITLDEGTAAELDNVARELGEKKSHIIRKALELYFDFLDLDLARRRLDDLEQGKDGLVAADEVWKKLDV